MIGQGVARSVLAALALAALPAAALAQRAPAGGRLAPAPIDSMLLRAHTYFLAHDLLEGRPTGRRGAELATLYIASQARALGLAGAGPGGSFYQEVPLVEARLDSARTGAELFRDGQRVRSYAYPHSFIPNVGSARTLVDFGGELVWVGTAREVLAHPARLPDLVARVAVMAGLFGAEAAAADTLRSRGARGVIHLTGDPQSFALYARSRGETRMYLAPEAQAVSSFIPDIPSIIAGPPLEVDLAREIIPRQRDAPGPFVLAGLSVAVRVGTHERRFTARNVAALLRGADRSLRDEFVVYTAHLDHLGVSTPDRDGDSIYNGFSDNAAGAAMLLAIAAAMARGERPARSVLFLWPTGEEQGLLGSDYFAARPLVSPGKIAGAINLDAGAPPAPPSLWRISGGALSTLGALAVEVAERAGWRAEPAPASPNSDYFPLLRIGVPAVFLVPGPAPFEGLTTEQSQALRRQWDRYHQASDHWASDYPFSGLVRYADYAYRLGMALARLPRQTMLTR